MNEKQALRIDLITFWHNMKILYQNLIGPLRFFPEDF